MDLERSKISSLFRLMKDADVNELIAVKRNAPAPVLGSVRTGFDALKCVLQRRNEDLTPEMRNANESSSDGPHSTNVHLGLIPLR